MKKTHHIATTERLEKSLKITTPADHRALLLATIEGVLEGRVSTQMANSVASLSAEVHKSLNQEWDMRCFITENISMKDGRIIELIGEEVKSG